MHLSRILLKQIAPGNIWIGKHRVMKPVKIRDKVDMFRRLAREEEAMFYLSRPYLTKDQEFRHGLEYGTKEDQYQRTIGKTRSNMLPNKYANDMLLLLRKGEDWE